MSINANLELKTEREIYLEEELTKAVRYLYEVKKEFAPGTTNSIVDDFLKKHNNLLPEHLRDTDAPTEKYTMIALKEDNGYWARGVGKLEGCYTWQDTLEEFKKSVVEAASLHLDTELNINEIELVWRT